MFILQNILAAGKRSGQVVGFSHRVQSTSRSLVVAPLPWSGGSCDAAEPLRDPMAPGAGCLKRQEGAKTFDQRNAFWLVLGNQNPPKSIPLGVLVETLRNQQDMI